MIPNYNVIGIWSPFIELGDISINKMTKETKNAPSRHSATYLKSKDHCVTIKNVIKGSINNAMTHIQFNLESCHGISKTFSIAMRDLVRFHKNDQGTHIVIKKECALEMFWGHDFCGSWLDPSEWGKDE